MLLSLPPSAKESGTCPTMMLSAIAICVLAFLMNEGYLVDIAMIYTMLSFLAVVLLTKIYMGVYREKRRRREATENQAKEGESHE